MNQYLVNGKTYNSVDEMPPDVRASYEAMQDIFADKNQNGVPDIMEGAVSAGASVMSSSTIVYEGKAYANVNDLPPEGRARYEQAMAKLADNNQDGVPDVLEGAVSPPPVVVTTQFKATSAPGTMPAHAAAPSAPAQGLGPVIVLGVIAIVLAIVIAILLWLLLANARGG